MKQILSQKNLTPDPRWHYARWIMVLVGLATLIIGWLLFTPAGFFGKLNAIGYAVCHQAPSHSFFIGNHQMPLCARCTGMYVGVLTALLYQLRYGQREAFPKTKIIVVFAVLLILFAVDGINSFISLPAGHLLYQPANWLRLITGIGLGWGMAAMLVPAFHQLVWKKSIPEPMLSKFAQIFILAVLDVLPVLAFLFEIKFLLYPIVILTTLTIPVLLSTIYGMLIIMVTYRENTFSSFKQVLPYLLAGAMIAMLQIFILDIIRLNLTGTWSGFPL
ncbi:MAG: DUF2085 domain-containing protein [Anaerolineaceae bacterium]|nr:DUF2085 domain-containing protein [Anaerolineaceae bacterium]